MGAPGPFESSAMDGSGRSRVQAFLLSSLQSSTQRRYNAALAKLVERCEEENVEFMEMSEEERDWFLAEWALEDYEAGESRAFHAELLSALAKSNPRVRYKVSYRVLDAWSLRQPPKQAPALPHEVLTMMFMLLVATGRPGMGCGAML